jgi:outer membrane lipoprotein
MPTTLSFARVLRLVAGFLLASLLSACAAAPPELAYQPESALLPYAPALNRPGAMARWSGIIASVRNEADQSVIEVVVVPLQANGAPEQMEHSPGRFLALLAGFADPTLYAKGRTLSVLGQLAEPVDGKIDQHPYRFSVIKVQKSKLWPPVKDVEIRYVRPFFGGFDDDWPRRRP